MNEFQTEDSRPGKGSFAGAGVMLFPVIQDTALTRQIHPADSTVDVQLLGDRITPVIQWLFQQAPWVMWGGVVLAAIIAFFILRWLWPRRRQGVTWLKTRSSNVKFALVACAVAAVGIAAAAGYTGYHFVETDKRFCNGCHLFVAGGRLGCGPTPGTTLWCRDSRASTTPSTAIPAIRSNR